MTVEIVEILGRADQGITKPFICRGEDGNVYFVKGKGAGRRSQICELVAGHLAKRFGLPIAPFEIVNVPSEIVALGFRPDIADLGAGPAFGSCARNVTELTPSLAGEVPQDAQLDVLAFDWWVRNGDRTLTDLGGNPNLFWNVDSEQLLVLDHNQAFDQTFTAEEFFSGHAFADSSPLLFGDWVARTNYMQRFAAAMEAWDEIIDAVPPEWFYADDEHTVPTNFDPCQARALLDRYQSDEFWSKP